MTFRFECDHDALAALIDPQLLDAMDDVQQMADEAVESVTDKLRLPDMFAERRQAIIDRSVVRSAVQKITPAPWCHRPARCRM